METKNIIVEKSLTFGVEIVRFSELLEGAKKYVVAKQILRCGTSVGANIFEAQHAESRSDFVHKMKIAVKEANETLYWLLICERSENYPVSSSLKEMIEELIRIISKIIISSKGSMKGRFILSLIAFSTVFFKIRMALTGV